MAGHNFIYKVQTPEQNLLYRSQRAYCQDRTSLVLWFVEAVSQAALPAVMTVKVAGHEHPGSTLISGTLAAQTVDLAVLINLRIKTDNLEFILTTPKAEHRIHA